ncbi:hypothetical protein KC19_5G029900 [Ceratodon purpureus]|uniref:HhH-GPD domain-containing protein n=1 Tax=Ceratodon purpureus TaxID=3225 RepID=A0A8T0HXF1_CERPU|nr:hypothetical protein KC19_5G029900 [Ceratodon purpureus]KAG0575773.1 hypothetical protein KC19_5G029900 [Ceratodon purpureus]KAG0575774.1 hypothetical protein KC19_5G029900 [Ceratodon purpureus]
MMPPGMQSAAYNLLPNDMAMLEKPGQKRRRESELTRGSMPNESLVNDNIQRSGNIPPINSSIFCELVAAQPGLAIERQNFLDRMLLSAKSGRFPLTAMGALSTYEPVGHQQNFGVIDSSASHINSLYRSLTQRPAARSLESAAAATAQAMANFQALMEEGRSRSLNLFQTSCNGYENGSHGAPFFNAQRGQQQQQQQQQQQLHSNHGFGSPTFRAPENNYFNSGIGSQMGFEDLSTFGGSNVNAYMRADSDETDWPNLTCQTTMSNGNRSLYESTPQGSMEPQSPSTPRGHQNTVLSDSHQEYLRHMERMNSIASDPESPRQNSSRGRRLSYAASQERPATDHTIIRDFEAAPVSHTQGEKHVHIYLDSVEVPKRVDGWASETHVINSPVPELTGVGIDAPENAQQERFSQSFERSAPVTTPAESNIVTGEKFDLNEVPVGLSEATTPKPRKKYHPRVAKDKRTYKRRVDGKKVPASPVGGFTNMNSPAKKAGKRLSFQTQHGSIAEEGRDANNTEVVDMDIDYSGYLYPTNSQHNTAVCDCEACIKLRLEKRMPQSPESPPQRHSLQSTSPRADSFSESPPVRRNLFEPSAQAPGPSLDHVRGPEARRSLSCFDATNDPPHQNTVVISHNSAAYSAVKSFFNTPRSSTSCLQQFNESATQLGLTHHSFLHHQNSLSSAIVPANPVTKYSPSNRVPAMPSNNSLVSRLCPRAILSPQTVTFRDMNQVQRIVYLRSILSSSNQIMMSPESLLNHVHDHLPETEKKEFKDALWPIVLSDLTADQEKQLRDYAQLEQVGACTAIEVVKRRGPGRVKKPQAMKSNVKAGKGEKGRKSIGSADATHSGLEMVPYDNKSMVVYDGPFDPLRKKKNRGKVVLDDETVRVWKLLMGKNGSERMNMDAEKELKWEEERRKMKTQAQNFIERMHIVIGDRSFSKWKGSVVDSVVGAFLTQNVNDVLSSSAFMSMRSRFPGRGFRRSSEAGATPEEAVAQSFEGELQHPLSSAQSPPMQAQSSVIPAALSSSQQPWPKDVATPQLNSGCLQPSFTVLESQGSHYEERYDILAGAASTEGHPGQRLDLQCCQKDDSKTSNSVVTDELSTGVNQGVTSTEIEVTRDLATDSLPSHGKYNPKTGLTGLERAKIEEKQVSARKDFDFSELQEEFKPRVQGQERLAAPPRTEETEDGVDWEAVRRADVAEVADVIKERGLNWILAGRIKAFLERIHLDYGALDLEWLRSMSTDQTKDFLLSIRGLGLKSVECIRLLTLHHLAFPVDTNVGRICVRLGWVPLEPLPEELQLHLLEFYPVQATIQKYLWPRLCKFDHKTLYELHYQMISFGKVFCTKTKPNCNACPMRPECKHFASALSSAKLALPASERPNNGPTLALPPGENIQETSRLVSQYCQPIIEEPMTPESEADIEDLDIEDYPFSVQELTEDNTYTFNNCVQDQASSTEHAATHVVLEQSETAHSFKWCSPSVNVTVPDIEPVPEPASESLPEPAPKTRVTVEDWGCLAAVNSKMKANRGSSPNSVIEIVDSADDLDNLENPNVLVANIASQEMVLVAPETASLPVPKLKNVGRLRTVHYVYELPDNHPLLDGLDPRESDDPCTYLLAIWGPGEVPESIPNMNDSANEESGPFASSSSEGEETIKATLLVPCRTAMRGSFPLNGTYFQVNEVFADHASSLQPMLVPRTLLWNLRRRFVFFGTSVISIFRGMTAEEIQACFWRGYVCVRGFDRSTRAPKPLVGRLHLQAGKAKGANMDG